MSRLTPLRSRGFTIVEVLVAMTLTGIVVAGTLRALTAQKKFYARQARILEARHAMRASAIILASEFRDVSAVGGDLYSIDIDGTGLQRLTDGMDPVWSPDGTELAFARWQNPPADPPEADRGTHGWLPPRRGRASTRARACRCPTSPPPYGFLAWLERS